MSSSIIEYLNYALIGMAAVIAIEAAIWVNACLGLSMRHREADFTEMIIRAPYRVFWPPKLLVAIVEIVLIAVTARYYRSGGQELFSAIICFVGLILFGVLVFWESVRAIGRYDNHISKIVNESELGAASSCREPPRTKRDNDA